jgi:biotin carboxyl carrier protein
MRLSIVRDGKRETVEVDPASSTVAVGGHRYPYKVIAEVPERIELEVGGEKVVVEGWPKGLSEPPGPVDVNGERWRLSEVRAEAGEYVPSASALPAAPASPPEAKEPPANALGGAGTTVVPPMPGKIIEVRVRVGDHVAKDQVLLVLEAMKMRHEIPSPVHGRVLEVAVRTGSNVRAHEAMVRVAPD